MKELIGDLKEKLRCIFEKDQRIVAVYLFGSKANGTNHPRSDLDLGVMCLGEYTLDDEIDLEIKIEEILGHDRFDLIILNKVSLILQFRIIAAHRLIYVRDDDKRCEIEERIMAQYYDFQPRLNEFNREYLEALRQEYSG